MDRNDRVKPRQEGGERAPSGPRRRAREVALQVLYQMEAAGEADGDPERAIARYFDHLAMTSAGDDEPASDNLLDSGGRPMPVDRPFLEQLVKGVTARRAELDDLLATVSRHWRLERMAMVERNVIRMAVYELKYSPAAPVSVVLNEAVELAKRYGTAEGAAFVNGLLDRAVAELRPG